MSSLDNVQLRVVDSTETAEEFLRWLGERREIIAIDSETTGLIWWEKDFLRLVQWGDTETGWTVSAKRWLGLIEIALGRYQGPVAFHNAQFDHHALESAGLKPPAWHLTHDTVALHHLFDPPASHKLKQISRNIWPNADAGERLLKAGFSKYGWNWATVPEEFEPYGLYAAMDTVLTARLYEMYLPEVTRCGMLPAYEREMAHMATMFRCERRGLRIDGEYTVRLRDYWATERERLKAELAHMGVTNPSSAGQVFSALNEGGWDPEEFTATGQPKMDKMVMAEIIRDMGVPADIATRVMEYRRITKWSSAYLDAFLGARSDDRGFVHPSIKTLGARTGRESITGPPLQTLPKGPIVRHCVLPYVGDQLYTVDYDAQELRLFAHYAQEPNLQQLFKDGLDPHAYTASLVYGLPIEHTGKGTAYRDTAKNVRFARLYGAGTDRMAATASASTVASGGVPVTSEAIEQFVAGLDAQFPGETAFIRYVNQLAQQRLKETGRGFVTTWGGRYMPGDSDKLYSVLNYLIQGSCADSIKSKMNMLDKAGYGDWIMIPVHDEILFSVPPGGEEAMPEVVSIMEDHTNFSIPLTCSAKGPFDRWGRAYE